MDEGNNQGGRERLTRDRICEAALGAIDEAGLQSVSMRTLADALGVKASSLYYHFASKDEVLTGVAEYLYRKLGRPPSHGDWAEQVKGTFIQLQDFIQAHPNAAPLLVRDLAYSPVAKKRAKVLLGILRRAGLDPTTSASLVSNVVALLVGHSLLALYVHVEAEPGGRSDGGSVAGTRVPRAWIHQLFRAEVWEQSQSEQDPVDAEPFVATELPSDAIFVAGLEALIKGFAPDGSPP